MEKNEIPVTLDGKTYTLKAGLNALVLLEEMFSAGDRRVTFREVMQHATRGSVSHIRAIVYAMTRKHHKELTLDAIGDLIDRVGLMEINAAFEGALASMVADAADLQALGVSLANPPQAPAKADSKTKVGTGGRSTLRRVRSA
jgi:hypothetical protein